MPVRARTAAPGHRPDSTAVIPFASGSAIDFAHVPVRTGSADPGPCCPAPRRISGPHDAAEREADLAAERVMRGDEVRVAARSAPALARKCADCAEEEREQSSRVRRDPLGDGAHAADTPPAVAAALAAPSRPLDPAARAYFEPRFGTSFADVRVHADAVAATAARGIHARAFTLGRHIAFTAGEYAPDSLAGRHLLAHELAHVVQGRGDPSGEVRRVPAGPGAEQPTPAAKVPTAANVQDCEGNDAKEVLAALRIAPGAARIAAGAIMTRPLPPATAAVLTRIFGPTAQQRTTAIALRLHLIAAGLPNVTCECEYPGSTAYDFFCSDALAYVRAVPAWFGIGNIHICQPQFRNLSQRDQVLTMVHEGAHRYINADGDAYYAAGCADTAETLALSDADRMNNADCYACLMQGIVSP